MSHPGEARLLAVLVRGADAADATARAWDRGEAVAILDPDRPDLAETLAHLAPTHVLDRDGIAPRPGGQPVAAGVGTLVATSGTTGAPRFVVLTRDALEASAEAVRAALGADERDRWLACLPLHYVAGLAIVARAYFTGASLTVLDHFEPTEVAQAAGDASLVSLVPTALRRLLDAHPDAPARFRRVLLGGGPVPPGLLVRAHERGAPVVSTYGLTETGGGCVHDGHALDGVDVTLEPSTNEILVRGPVVMVGYHDDAAATLAAFTPDGRLRTGDAGAFGPDGALQVVDRLRDLVITGGVNVSPTRVERALQDHDEIVDVCVTGEPDPEWGERVVAYVVPRDRDAPPTLEDLRARARASLPAAALPRALVLVEAIPRTASGKPLRRGLRRRAVTPSTRGSASA